MSEVTGCRFRLRDEPSCIVKLDILCVAALRVWSIYSTGMKDPSKGKVCLMSVARPLVGYKCIQDSAYKPKDFMA